MRKKKFLIPIVTLVLIATTLIFATVFHSSRTVIYVPSGKPGMVDPGKTSEKPLDKQDEEVPSKGEGKEDLPPEVKPEEKPKRPSAEEKKPLTPPSVKPEVRPEQPPVSETPTVKPLSQEEKNDQFRKSIEKKYKITVKYGREFLDYRPRGYQPTYMVDASRISKYLTELDRQLSYYPVSIFGEFEKADMKPSFYLVESVPGNAFSGLTDKEFYDDIRITLTTTGFFYRVVHHEFMHFLDAYMEIKLYPNTPYVGWEDLNPTNYRYGSFDATYNYSLADPNKMAYFVNNYGQTNVHEDRATIFEDLMARAYAPNGCYLPNTGVGKKARLLSQVLRKAFPSLQSGTVYHWERFIQ